MKAIRKHFRRPRWLAALLCICIILPYLNGFTLSASAQPPEQEGLCEHHPAHTKECGFAAETPEQPCNHQHDESCGYIPAQPEIPCDSNCGQETPGEEEDNRKDPSAPEEPTQPGQTPEEEQKPEGDVSADGDETIPGDENAAVPEQTPGGEDQPDDALTEELPQEQTPLDDAPIVHAPDCAYRPAQPAQPCNHQHDENCGYAPAQPASPCGFLCEKCREDYVQSWEYLDEEELLVFMQDANLWGLGVPGVSRKEPLTAELLAELLPAEIHAQLGGGKEADLPIVWDLSAIPEEGLWEGLHIVQAVLPEEYRLAQGAPALQALLAMGDADLYAEPTKKYVNQWSFINYDGEEIQENILAIPISNLNNRELIIQQLKETLPKQIRAWCYGTTNAVESGILELDTSSGQIGIEMTEDGPKEYTSGVYWGKIDIDWEDSFLNLPSEFQYDESFILMAKTKSNPGYSIIVNANDRKDDTSDTSKDPSILSISVTLKDMNLDSHIVHSVEPENVTVNLFDYWVEDYGENPTPASDSSPGEGDILQKSDWHYRPKEWNSPETDLTDYGVAFSTKEDWNKGINEGHLLLFGDGLTHAGLWNKGAGQNTFFGQKYAGMEQIVKNILGNDGYPEMNLNRAREVLSQDRDEKLVRDYKLAGDHISANEHDKSNPAPYEGANIQNLSEGLIALWERATGQSIETGVESLAYLFDPEATDPFRKTYTNITGLFQLDDEGYYYYNMRQNFAEFQADGTIHEDGRESGKFVLYDAPATTRTDGTDSIGNFFPFNKGEEVFNGLDEQGKLTSSVSQSRNTMNHHLGMTVQVDFRQPSNGKIKMGSGESQPMTFGFSGDDDVWVFVDDVLVLDIGGTHSELYGTIDFSTGDVYVGRAFDAQGIPENPADTANMVTYTTLRELYQKAGKEDSVSWNGKTFSSNSVHTLKMFYLERGNYDSSIALRFNLQPLLYQQIKKVDQNGEPLQGASFELYEALQSDDGAIVGTNGDAKGKKYNAGTEVFATLTSGANGIDQFVEKEEEPSDPAGKAGDPKPFNFADRENEFYILRETNPPEGYRRNPIDILLQYHHDTDTITVVNRWTTGVVSSFTDHIAGNSNITYGLFNMEDGSIGDSKNPVSITDQENGLIMAVPMIKVAGENPRAEDQETSDGPANANKGLWKAMYGSNLGGYHVVTPVHRTAEHWRKALLKAALYQCVGSFESSNESEGHRQFPAWYLEWNEDACRIEGKLEELPGMAEQYQFNYEPGSDSFKEANMKMAYAIIDPKALAEIGVSGSSDQELYESMAGVVKQRIDDGSYASDEAAIDALVNQIYGVTQGANGRGVSFLNVGQFTQNAQSMIYIPNEQRELRVWKVDQDGKGVNGVTFGLYQDEACTNEASQGVTARVDGRDGVLIFSPGDDASPGHAPTTWANADQNNQTDYYLKELSAPQGYTVNPTIIPVKVGQYSIYADAGEADDGVQVMASVGKLAKTMLRFAISEDMDITLRDITAFAQSQPSDHFQLGAEHWQDVKLDGANGLDIQRFMHLHYGQNATVDYGLHDVDGGGNLYPVFVTDEDYLRARVKQNWPALNGEESLGGVHYGDPSKNTANKEDLTDVDITNLFSLINVVVVTDKKTSHDPTGQLTISKTVEGDGLNINDYTKLFQFRVELTDAEGNPLEGDFRYYFYGEDKSGEIANNGTILLHHDERVTILGLPVGAKWKVTEMLGETYAGWYPTPASGVISGSIEEETTAKADFINRKEPSLEIKKIIDHYDETKDQNTAFTFIVQFVKDGQALTGQYPYVKFDEEGKAISEADATISSGASIALKHGESVVVRGLPVGTQCTVTESAIEGWEPRDPATKPIEEESLTEIVFINAREGTPPPEEPKTGDLTIEKIVQGSDLSESFAFIVTLFKDGKELEGEFEYDGAQTGKIHSGGSILLKHSQKITIHKLPVGVQFTVKEQAAEGWKEQEDQTGTIQEAGNEITFINEKKPQNPPVTPDKPEDPGDDDDDPDDPPPEKPKDPEEPKPPVTPPENPKNPETPENPPSPETPENPLAPETPDEPAPPENPGYPTELPDPNDPDSPEEITIWEDGVPTTYIKVWDPEEEEWEYIPEDEVPLGRRFPDNPKTGDSRRLALWLALSVAALAGMALTAQKTKRK